jgi:gas vesicle protein GvpK
VKKRAVRKRAPVPKRRQTAAKPTALVEATPVTARQLRALQRELKRRTAPARWNPNPEDVQKSVAHLVLTIVEFLRKLMERQAIRRMEAKTLTPKEVEAVGLALMQLEETVREIGQKFGITPEELNLDLGAIKLI